MTLKEVANKIGVTEATAQRYESANGIKSIPYDIIEKYAEIFDVSPSYIMGWSNNIIDWDKTIKANMVYEDRLPYNADSQNNNSAERIPKKSVIEQSSDDLVDDLVNRLYELTPRQRMKVIDAILTLLDYTDF
jgi:transcriptional regulator with XRE-family HTH domain